MDALEGTLGQQCHNWQVHVIRETGVLPNDWEQALAGRTHVGTIGGEAAIGPFVEYRLEEALGAYGPVPDSTFRRQWRRCHFMSLGDAAQYAASRYRDAVRRGLLRP